MNAFHFLDTIIFGKLLQPPTTEQIEDLVNNTDITKDSSYNAIDEATGDLDSKTAALLTHISILVAGLLVLYSTKTGLFKSIILIELCLYLFLAVCCLRTIRFTFTYIHKSGGNSYNISVFAEEFYKRGLLYNAASSATIYLTIAMVFTLIIDGILQVRN